MRRVFFAEVMTSTPFQEGLRRERVQIPDVEIVTTPDTADVICARAVGPLAPFLHVGKSVLVWTHEPASCGTDTKSVHDTSTGGTIHMSTAFNGDIYLSPLHYFPFLKLNRAEIMASLADRSRTCAILATYRAKFDRYISGRNVDITEYRQRMAIHLSKSHDACDIYGRGWPASVKVMEDSRGAGWQARKLDALGDYKFNISCENTVSKDYITEKIWQAIQSGAVPIYFGRGTGIDQVLAPTSYIDPGLFHSFDDLHDRIAGMSMADRTAMVTSAQDDYERIFAAHKRVDIDQSRLTQFSRRLHEIS